MHDLVLPTKGDHLFYISPGGKGTVSEDMVHWEDARIPGIAGLTGQMQVTENEALLSFARGRNGVYLAASDEELESWTTWKALAEDELKADHSTPIDSFFWQEDDQWWMVLRQAKERTGLYHWDNKFPRLSLFHSWDLRTWTRHPEPFFEKRYGIERGHDLACASLMPIGKDRHLLYYFVHARGPAYTIGKYHPQSRTFEEEHSQQFSFAPVLSGALHAPSGLITPDGRLVTIFNSTGKNRGLSGSRFRGLEGNDVFTTCPFATQKLWQTSRARGKTVYHRVEPARLLQPAADRASRGAEKPER